MDSLGVVELILSLCERIYDMVGRTKTNKQQCQSLAERVKGLEGLVLTIVERKDSKISRVVRNALKDLSKTLITAKELMEKFSGTKTFKAFLKSGSHEEKFREVNEKLSHNFQVLSGALQIEHGAILHKVYKHVAKSEDELSLRSSTPLMSPPIPSRAMSPSIPSRAMSPSIPSTAMSPSTSVIMMSPTMSMFQSPPPTHAQVVTSMYQNASPMQLYMYNPLTPRLLISTTAGPAAFSVPNIPGTYKVFM